MGLSKSAMISVALENYKKKVKKNKKKSRLAGIKLKAKYFLGKLYLCG